MTGILPLVTATALGMFAMQPKPKTVWRQVIPSGSDSGGRQSAEKTSTNKTAADGKQPIGGEINDPLPADYGRSGRQLPGPVLNPARPLATDQPADDDLRDVIRPIESETRGLRDVIEPVRRAAANKPLAPKEPDSAEEGPAFPEHSEDEEPSPPDDSIDPEPAPESPAAATTDRHEESDDRFAKTVRSSQPDKPDKRSKTDKKGTAKKIAADNEPSSPSDPPPGNSQTSGQATGTLMGLFASLGANVFLLWVAASQRGRYRALVRSTFENDLPSDRSDAHDDLPHWEEVDEDQHAAPTRDEH